MEKKKVMTLAEAKRNMIKSGLFAGAAILVLIFATLAWFSAGSKAAVEEISANVESSDVLIANFYRYEDVNKDNVIGNDPTGGWIGVDSGENINTGAMVPGQKSYYKVVVRSTYPNLKIDFNNIVFAGIPLGGDMALLTEYLQKMNVEIRSVDGAESPIGTTVSSPLNTLLGSSLVNGMSKTVFNVDISSHQNEEITIYYTLAMSEGLEETDLAQGFNISIGEVRVVHS